MRTTGCMRFPLFCVLALALLIPAPGCGSKKKTKKGKTVAAQRDDAKAETTPDRRAAAFLKLARQQAAAGDKTGAKASALDAYREFYPDAPKKPAAPEQEAEAAEEPKPEEPKPEEPKPEDAGEAKPADENAAAEKQPAGQEPVATEGNAPTEEAAPAEEKPAEEPAPPVEERPALDPNIVAPRLVEIAEVFAILGDKKQARNVLAKAIAEEFIGPIEDPVRKSKILAEAGAIFGAKAAGIGDAGRAKAILAKAADAAERVDERFRAEALAAVALGYTRSNLANLADKTVEGLMKAAENLDEPRAKAEALAAAANVKAQTGKKEEATALLKDAAESAKSVTRPESKAYALLAVASATNSNGDAKSALSLLKEADKAANKVSEPDAMKTIVDKVRALTLELEKKKKK
jgi:tetratricopeptide (TPR) repeat protein